MRIDGSKPIMTSPSHMTQQVPVEPGVRITLVFEDNGMVLRTYALASDCLSFYSTIANMEVWAAHLVSLGLSFPVYFIVVLPKLFS